ncbi:MAG: PAS domain-containing protein, partial [Treponema sp.]|nr:PAS domain-containing protein [Treponema sp.]
MLNAIKRFFKIAKTWMTHSVYSRVLVVFLAFAIMIIFSYLFVSSFEYKNMVKNAENALSHTESEIAANLFEHEAFLTGFSETVRLMILQGDSVEKVTEYIQHITNYLLYTEDILSGFHGANGFFEIFGNKFISGQKWTPPDAYVVQSRPWYKAAVTGKGAITVTDPFMDMMSDDVILTFARRIFDEKGRPLGILCLDIKLDRLINLALDMRITEGGYGVLLDKKLISVAHPDPREIGKYLRDVPGGVAYLTDELEQGFNISERKIKNYKGEDVIVFFRQIKYGWYLGIVTPYDKYHQTTRSMAFFLAGLGALLALCISAILLRMFTAKVKFEKDAQNEVGKEKANLEYAIIKYKLTSNALGIVHWDMDIINGDPASPENKITLTPEYRHMLGFTDENDLPDILSSWISKIHPDDYDWVFRAFSAHLNDHSGKTPYDVEYRMMMKNGDYRYFHTFGSALRDSEGVPVRVAGAMA